MSSTPERTHVKTVTVLFTDIEGSTQLTEQQPELMRLALSRHDELAREIIEGGGGTVVQLTGDGIYAFFGNTSDTIAAAVRLQQVFADAGSTGGIRLSVRCGMHLGAVQPREQDLFFGGAINRAARIMSAAHGGQVLVSEAAAISAGGDLPPGVRLRDLGLVRLRGFVSPERVYQVVHPDLQDTFPPLRAQEGTPSNLPHQTTAVIGREHELHTLRRLLSGTRLLTLTGPGGIGKTRLALELATHLMDAYPDGIWFVDLAPLNSPELVLQELASVLSVREQAGQSLQNAVADFARERQLLVILDNCEHLLTECSKMATMLLHAGPHVKVVASSRERLRVTGETIFEVPPLSIPPAGVKANAVAAMEYQSVRLFAARAAQINPAFEVTDRTAIAVMSVCQQLDGIPLALELAAARVGTMPVHALAQRLTDRFRMLTQGDRTRLPRQQTLRALIDWSYDLLAPEEQLLLRRLSVFAGSCTLEAVSAVCTIDDSTNDDALDTLTRLVEKSMVVLDSERWRYRLLDTVRQYASERLQQAGVLEATRNRHLEHYAAFAETARLGITGAEQRIWLTRVDLERDNLVAAHAWCGSTERGAELGLSLVHSLKNYWLNRGLLGTGYQMTLEALARSGQQSPALQSRVLFDAGWLAYFMGRYSEARKHLETSLAIATELSLPDRIAAALQPLGMACLAEGDTHAARHHLEQAVALARELGDPRDLASAVNALAQLHRSQGELQLASELYGDVLSLARSLGDRESIGLSLLNVAIVCISRGELSDVRALLLEALEIGNEIGSRPVAQSVLDVCAGLAAATGDGARAARFYGAAQAHMASTGIQRDIADQAFLTPLVERAKAQIGPATFSSLEASVSALAEEDATREVHAWLRGGT